MTLFLIRRCLDCEGDRLAYTATALEGAVSVAETFTKDDQDADWITVTAVAPGPGPGVEVARWRGMWRPGETPDDQVRHWERVL